MQNKSITLVCIDCKQHEKAIISCENIIKTMISTVELISLSKNITFKFLSDCLNIPDNKDLKFFRFYLNPIKIPKISSKKEYSLFVMNELYKYIDTDLIWIVQHDSGIVNPSAWNNDFLNYDYIGACWWRNEPSNVGNGGFSIRSKKLMQYIAENPLDYSSMPDNDIIEDDIICRKRYNELIEKGFTFAPENIASKFSFERNGKYLVYNGAFGYHGNYPHELIKDTN
jgi:hypothetical protein